jgi:galactonate dehydratase
MRSPSITAAHRRQRLMRGFGFQAASVPVKTSELDIAEIRHFAVREPVSGVRYSLIRVTTRGRLTGWGECGFDPAADLKALQSSWLGKPAHTYAAIQPATPFAAALDMALLDIVGKKCNAPIYRVLGGPTRSKVRAYHAESVIELPEPLARNQGKAYQNRIIALVDAVPGDRDFVLAGNARLTPGDAASVAAAVERKHPMWFDEPCAHSNLEAVRKISGETVVPLGFGRGIQDAGVFQAMLREGLVDLVRPELSHFGISGSRRVAALAEPYYVAVAPRHDGGPVASAAAIQLAASIPNFFIQHVPLPSAPEDRAMRREIVTPDVETSHDGFLSLPKTPGLGISINEAALEKYRAS